MSEISSFRFWCQKVLPAVYDDSLSYYELLCKVVAKLNEVINSQNGTNDHVTELAQQFEQLKNDLQGTIESEAEKVVDNYVKSNNLVKSINGITAVAGTGEITLQASDVGAIANVNDSVKENNIQDGSVTSGKIAAGAVGSTKIAQDAVTASKLENGSVSTAKIQDRAVTASKIAAGSVGNDKIADGSITSDKITNGAVQEEKIATGAISSRNIAANAVDTDNVKDGSITSNKLAPDAFPVKSVNAKTGEVVLNAEDVGAIANTPGAVTAERIAGGSVTNPKIADDTITIDKMANIGAENAGKLLKIGSDGKPAWLKGEGTVTAGVESVNGKDGVVTLTAEDVGAIASGIGTVKGKNLDIRATSGDIAAIREITKTPTGIVRLAWPGGLAIRILANDTVAGEAFSTTNVGPFSFAGMRIDGGEDKCRITGLTEGKTIVGNADGSFHYQAIPLSVNGKTGIVVLSADDIEGALREVAPSNVLTNESAVGAYLFLAPADGEADAFKKVDKLPENMLPTNIDGSILKDNTVGTSKLVGLSVTSEKIGTAAVTGAKMAANSVSTACVQDGAVTLPKLNQPGAAESGKVLGVSAAGKWELQRPSGGADWEEIPATSLIDGATVHCRIQPGTGWLWFSIDSDSGENITIGNASSSGTSTKTEWGTINVNVVNSPVPPNGTSASTDSYVINGDNLTYAYVTSSTINSTSVKKLNWKRGSATISPYLAVKRNATGVTHFGFTNGTTAIQTAIHAEFYVNFWFDNRTYDDSEKYPSV